MSSQLVVSINSTADYFRWCWLGDDQASAVSAPMSADLDALRAALGDLGRQAWLLLPGAKVVTRSLEYTEKEKKHLRSLLPFCARVAPLGSATVATAEVSAASKV